MTIWAVSGERLTDFSNNSFRLEKITDAILKAMVSVGKGDVKAAEKISQEIYKILLGSLRFLKSWGFLFFYFF